MSLLQKLILSLLGLIIVVIAGAAIALGPTALGMARVLASTSCSLLFAGQIPPELVLDRDLRQIESLNGVFTYSPDMEARTSTTKLFGFNVATAVYREGYACATVGAPWEQRPRHTPTKSNGGMALPDATATFPQLAALIANEFDTYQDGSGTEVNHRAFVMLHQGRLIAEHYAEGYSPEMSYVSQSMAKSVNALIWSVADAQGLADLDGPVAAPEWSADDPRQQITSRHLLNMTSGLDFDENYEFNPFGQIFQMALSGNLGRYAAGLELGATPGERWYYSTADANLSGRALGLALEERGVNLHEFAEQMIFDKIGADSVELATDDAGHFWAGSAVYATPRDWARIGQLILDDGVVEGEAILPSDFVELLGEPLPQSKGWYRLSMWLNQSLQFGDDDQLAPGLPEDTITFAGFQGQRVQIIPSSDIVIVRKGLTTGAESAAHYKAFIADAYAMALQEGALQEGALQEEPLPGNVDAD